MTIYRDSQFTPVREPERARRASRLIPLLSLACGLSWALSGCVESKQTRIYPDGSKEVIESREFKVSPATRDFAEDFTRHRLRMPPRTIHPAK